ncbi:hypothetical protein CSIM01_10941 [Colletotrichum simmondsii]|uniref:Uncharacterized protein n=1 Tax=Colletotrichum simmondsii TaxID=703756 RepID=A0A135TY28_9PEZI|nr:hypothetical protein CSIM01_10941 [Colletotrichum simmondsii]
MHPTASLIITNVARKKSIKVVHNTTNSSSQGRVPATSATQYASAIKRVGHPRREPGPDRIYEAPPTSAEKLGLTAAAIHHRSFPAAHSTRGSPVHSRRRLPNLARPPHRDLRFATKNPTISASVFAEAPLQPAA